jgi:hypothetical protein
VQRPACRDEWCSPPTPPQVLVTTPTAHGSWAPKGLWCPLPPRSCAPIRPSRRLPLLSPEHWLYRGAVPATRLRAANEPLPALGSCSFLACRHPYAERRNEGPQSLLASRGLPPQNTESAPLFSLPSAPVRALLTPLQGSLHATARKVASPPGLVRPRALLWPPRTLTSELARSQSPGPRVGYHYTALLGETCGRTCTGWSTTVTGCTLWRKVYGLYHILKRSLTKNTTNCG